MTSSDTIILRILAELRKIFKLILSIIQRPENVRHLSLNILSILSGMRSFTLRQYELIALYLYIYSHLCALCCLLLMYQNVRNARIYSHKYMFAYICMYVFSVQVSLTFSNIEFSICKQ